MNKKNVLVFPCGTEIALEIHRSLSHCAHVTVYGANSIEPNHGTFVFKNYLDRLPMVYDPMFPFEMAARVNEHGVDYIYPAHDDVVLALSRHRLILGCEIIGSPLETCELCRSKSATYARFTGILPVPRLYPAVNASTPFPVFLKPDKGQGSRGIQIVHGIKEWEVALQREPSLLSMEYLSGAEYTVDCFTDRHGIMRFAGPRERVRTMNGISVHVRAAHEVKLLEAANVINETMSLQGAWFFQMKRHADGRFVLLEIAPRVSGGMGYYRSLGINLPLLSIYDRSGCDVEIMPLDFAMVMDRALIARFRAEIYYKHVYVDLDDTLVHDTGVDVFMIAFLFQCRNLGKKLHLLTRHAGNISETLKKYALTGLFSTITHLEAGSPKSVAIKHRSAIFLDDSHAERKEVHEALGIPVFAPDAIEALLDWRR